MSKIADVQRRFIAGETINAGDYERETGASRSLVYLCVKMMKARGFEFDRMQPDEGTTKPVYWRMTQMGEPFPDNPSPGSRKKAKARKASQDKAGGKSPQTVAALPPLGSDMTLFLMGLDRRGETFVGLRHGSKTWVFTLKEETE